MATAMATGGGMTTAMAKATATAKAMGNVTAMAKRGDERGAEETPRISPSRLHVGPNDWLKKLITH